MPKLKIKLDKDKGAKMPTRAYAMDAGLDLYSPICAKIYPRESVVIDTGVHIELPPYTAGFLKSKSGLNVNLDLTSEGVIDSGYTGSIKVKLYNNGGHMRFINAGDKISQLVILPVILPAIEEVEELADSERGANGFGSTGRA